MKSHQKQIGESRASERIPLQCSIVLASGIQVGEGQVLNMSDRGCLVESSVSVKAGDYLQLRFSLHESEPPCVCLGRLYAGPKASDSGSSSLEWKRRTAPASIALSPRRGAIHGQEFTTRSGLGNLSVTVFGHHRE